MSVVYKIQKNTFCGVTWKSGKGIFMYKEIYKQFNVKNEIVMGYIFCPISK